MSDKIMAVYNRAPVVFERGEGAWLYTADGDAYLDCVAGIATNGLGHANPILIAALTEQAGKIWHLSNIFRRDQFRQHSYISLAATGIICGLGGKGYELAVEAMANILATSKA